MPFLQGILAKLSELLFNRLLVFLKDKASDLFFYKKVDKKVNAELEAVLEAKNIIAQKRKDGEKITDEDYDRLKNANRRFNAGTF